MTDGAEFIKLVTSYLMTCMLATERKARFTLDIKVMLYHSFEVG